MTITPYQSSDKERCLAIFNSNRPQYFMDEELPLFSTWLDERALDGCYFVVKQEGKIVACGGYYHDPRYKKAGLSWGMVDAALHGKGIGKKLTTYRLQKMMENHPNSCYMLDTSQHTYQFYEKLGYRVVKITKDGFGLGMDKYYMELDCRKALL